MPLRRRVSHRRLSDDQYTLLTWGVMIIDYPGETTDDVVIRLFGSEDAARATWERHRMRLMAEHRRQYGPGTRPWGWWRFESDFRPKPFPEGYPGQVSPVDETAWLLQHNRMTAAERAELDVSILRRHELTANP